MGRRGDREGGAPLSPPVGRSRGRGGVPGRGSVGRGEAPGRLGGVASAEVFKPGAEVLARSVGAAPLEVRDRALRRPPHVPLFLLRACVREAGGGPVPPGVSGSRDASLPPSLSPAEGFFSFFPRPLSGVWGGVVPPQPPARAPSLPAPCRGGAFAALPSGCVPAAPGGRRPGGSAASEDLPPPGTRTAAAAPFPAGPPGAPAPPPLQAAAMDEKYLPELMAEKDSLDPSFTHALRLVNQGEGRRGRSGAAWSRLGERAAGAEPQLSDGRRGCRVRGLLFVPSRSVGFFLAFRLRVLTGSCLLPLATLGWKSRGGGGLPSSGGRCPGTALPCPARRARRCPWRSARRPGLLL